jgi:hypothetical protein
MLVVLTGCGSWVKKWNEWWGVPQREAELQRLAEERANRPVRWIRVQKVRGPGPLGRTTIYILD